MSLIKNSRGFSLVEVMLAGSLMVGVALTLTKLTQSTNKAIKHSENRNEFEIVFTRTAAILVEELNCYETLRGLTNPVDNQRLPVSDIFRCENPEMFMANVSAVGSNDPRDEKFVHGYECSINQEAPNYHVSCRHEGRVKCEGGRISVFKSNTPMVNDTFEVNYTFVVDNVNNAANSGRGHLELLFTKTDKSKNNSLGGASLRRIDDIIFELEPTTKNIRRCLTDINGSINTAVARACTGNSARLEGDPTDPNNPLRCVHDVDTTIISGGGSCPPNSFLDGYKTGPHPVTGGTNTLIPNCQPLNTKTTGCPAGQFVVEKPTATGEVRLSCHDLPVCGAGEQLAKAPDGFLACTNIRFNCPSNSLMTTRDDGTIDCKVCGANEALVKTAGGTWECRSPSIACNDSKSNGQEYMVGINSDGTPMCRKLITQEAPCQYGAQLTIKSDGSVGSTCCPSCSAAETNNICLGSSFVSSNSCGSICLGTKPIRNGSPGPWYTVVECSSWNHKKIERRNCLYSECGGDAMCSGHEMERETDCWLYNDQHTFAQCSSNGGSVNSQGSFFLCYFSGNIPGGRIGGNGQYSGEGVIGSHGQISCPSGWSGLNSYSTANYAGCGCSRSSKDGCSLPDCQTAGVSGWWRSNSYNTSKGYDARRTGFWGCGTNNSEFTCYAQMTERGCY